jgi:hypothetical protein
MNWSVQPDLIYANKEWGQKNKEFVKFMNVPSTFPSLDFEIMITGITSDEKRQIERHGWKVSDALLDLTDADKYRKFITASTGEFSVAKQTYVRSNSGWFSGRSACYLASGRPVIAQDTMWSKYLPTGKGLFAFHDIDTAESALANVARNLVDHSKWARQVAEEYFDSSIVLKAVLDSSNNR